jgi:multimeric flavodoxin WrbA
METHKRVLLLVGSPKGPESSSEALGRYLLGKLGDGGFETQGAYIHTLMRSAEGQQALLELVKASDILILSFPLYVDSLPATMIAALERIAQQQAKATQTKKQKLVAIVNNGFPEASQNNTAIAICKRFAFEVHFEWMGGLSMGGGGVIGGQQLDRAGFAAKNARKALDLAAKDLLEGEPVSQQAVQLMAKMAIPKWLYIMISNRGWKKQAKAFGAADKLENQP